MLSINVVMSVAVLFGLVALILRRSRLTRWSIVFLGAVIFLREISIYTFHKEELGEMARQGTLTEEFTHGALLISNYCGDTRLIMLLALLMLMILGYWTRSRKEEKLT